MDVVRYIMMGITSMVLIALAYALGMRRGAQLAADELDETVEQITGIRTYNYKPRRKI